jgi:hypothetical protein
MPKNALTKQEMQVRVLKLKNQLHNEQCDYNSKQVAERYLNEVLFIIEQYSR